MKRRSMLLTALGFIQARCSFQVHGVEQMDDSTLFAVVIMGLATLYVLSGDHAPASLDTYIDYVPQPQQPDQPQPPTIETTPSAPAGPQPQPPTIGGSGDQIDLSSAVITGGSPNVRGWPITTELRIAQLEPAIVPSFDDPGWPDIVPPGFEGPIQYTVWAFGFVGGRWTGAGFIEMWRGRPDCGGNDAGNVRDQLWKNWWYYVPELAGYRPAPGDSIAFMVTSGDARMGKGPFSVQQRSNVVVVTV